uniref:TSA: Wollemia nobilis Ref_Wollemi_Transcript_22106_1180 transcribed RNA sequence n=1 Tax=Wollemia nobilis TaxID=56998 RepID=A0A0C9S202_9CONI
MDLVLDMEFDLLSLVDFVSPDVVDTQAMDLQQLLEVERAQAMGLQQLREVRRACEELVQRVRRCREELQRESSNPYPASTTNEQQRPRSRLTFGSVFEMIALIPDEQQRRESWRFFLDMVGRAQRMRRDRAASPEIASSPAPAPRSVVEGIPMITITCVHVVDDLRCAICKEAFEVGKNARQIPRCNHSYHSDCFDYILPWLSTSKCCPLCRQPLPC